MTEKEEWFKEQCKQEGLSTEEITVFGGDYATNRDGDFLYRVKYEYGSCTMNHVAYVDMVDAESSYPEWLVNLTENMEENYRQGDELLASRSWFDRQDIAHCFKECICRNRQLDASYRHRVRIRPTMGVITPLEKHSFNQIVLGVWNTDVEDMPCNVLQPDELLKIEGYRFATKVIKVEDFIQTYSLIQQEDQFGPFQMLADLEKRVNRTWQEERKIRIEHLIPLFATESKVGYPELLWFRFSHFEVEKEMDPKYRTIFVVYYLQYDV